MTLLTPTGARRPTLDGGAWLRSVARPGPERWLWWVAAAGWLVLLLHPLLPWAASSGHGSGGAEMSGMGHHSVGASTPSWSPVLWHGSLWAAMIAATMLPLVAWNVRFVALHSPRRRRSRASVEVVLGWAVPWAGPAVALAAGTWLADRLLGPATAVLLGFAAAGCWQLTRRKRLAVARCHRTLAPPLGPAASGACVRFGVALGRDCVTSCWAGMLAMSVADHRLLAVVPLAWLSWFDRRRPPDQPGTTTTLLVLAATAALVLALPPTLG